MDGTFGTMTAPEFSNIDGKLAVMVEFSNDDNLSIASSVTKHWNSQFTYSEGEFEDDLSFQERAAEETFRTDCASIDSNPGETVVFADDCLSLASSVTRHVSYDFNGDEIEDDLIFPEEEEDFDQRVAQEFSKLSIVERQKALYDLHAILNVDDYRPPSPEIQRSLLQQVQRIIREEIPHSQKGVYEQAMQMDASYVNDDRFVLKFLRADGWDPKRAAVRLVKHFKVKLELFPLDLLCRDITQDDLDPQTLAVLYNEKTLDLPLRDMAGRIITVLIPGPGYDVLSKVSY
jgi:hypothetical protein